jgi:biopolymer transport protein ExbB
LIGLSVVCVAIILERAYFFAATRDDVEKLRGDLLAMLKQGQLTQALKRLQGSRSFEAMIAAAALEVAGDGPDAASERVQGEQQIARLHMERNLAFLGTVGNNAPFVGLLGTVIGIIRAFHSLDDSQGKITAGLMADIGEALVATAIGILVALPAVAGRGTGGGEREGQDEGERGSAGGHGSSPEDRSNHAPNLVPGPRPVRGFVARRPCGAPLGIYS